MPTEMLTKNERGASETAPGMRSRDDEALRKLLLRHLEHVRKFKI
jgi:hypothetical protein